MSIRNTSRVHKTLLNVRIHFIFYSLTLIVSFFSRKIFLDSLGADFIGFTGSLSNLLSYLNLAELGVGTAIGYVLYKPLFERDKIKINEIISVFGYLYLWIGRIILILGVLLALFIPLIFPKTGFDIWLIYFAYCSFLASSLIGYFLNYKQTLLSADQRNYVVTAYYQGSTIIKTLIQMLLAYYTGNYYLWVLIELSFGVIYSFILNWRIRKTYPWLESEIKEGKRLFEKYPEIIRYTKQLFIQKLSGTVQWQSVPFLTYAFASLQMVAYYGNYSIITDKLSQSVRTFLEGSTEAGVGNLIAEGNKEKIKNVFWQLLSFRYFLGGVISFCLYMLADSFISLWLGKQYILPHIVLVLIVINVFISYTRGGVTQFLYGYGLFYDVWASIAEIIINLSIACVCGYLYGLPGVLLGGIISQILIVNIWKPYFLYSSGFKESIWYYWIGLFRILLLVVLPMCGVVYLLNHCFSVQEPTTWMSWFLYSIVIFTSYTISTFVLMFVFVSNFRSFIFRFIKKKKL